MPESSPNPRHFSISRRIIHIDVRDLMIRYREGDALASIQKFASALDAYGQQSILAQHAIQMHRLGHRRVPYSELAG